jgi:hypothetical protein
VGSDAFKRRLVRSGTDFEIYNNAGMEGLDLAFYQRRSLYHTAFDSVSTLGSKRALSAMMEAALGTAQVLADDLGSSPKSDPVYFDSKHTQFWGLSSTSLSFKS